MQVKSKYRYAKISPFKVREVTREIQGLFAADAQALLRFVPKKAAALVLQALESAMANAENNLSLRRSQLVVESAVVGEGPTRKHWRPRARGSANRIRKRTSHIEITLNNVIDPKKPQRTSATSKQSKGVAKSTGKSFLQKRAFQQVSGSASVKSALSSREADVEEVNALTPAAVPITEEKVEQSKSSASSQGSEPSQENSQQTQIENQ